jgi:hypothetical protein
MDEADRASGLIRRATHDGMLLNHLDEVQSTLERLTIGTELAAIRVYDREGAIALSSDRSEIGLQLPKEAPQCTSCHEVDSTDAVRVEARQRSGTGTRQVLRKLSVIESEAACMAAGCHERDRGQRVLGVLEVEMSMRPLQAAQASACAATWTRWCCCW